jgi:hypothetical protein
MLTFQKYTPDKALYYAPCLPAALAYLPVFSTVSALTLTQVSERVGDYGLSADMRDVTYAVALLADAGYVEAHWTPVMTPPPTWYAWPFALGLAELVRYDLPLRLAQRIAGVRRFHTFVSLVHQEEYGWPLTDLAGLAGFGRGAYQTFGTAVRAFLAAQSQGAA